MKKRKLMGTLKRAGSLLLSAALSVSLIGCGKENVEENAEEMVEVLNEEEKALQKTITDQLSATHSSTEGKEETVYILADASGNPKKVIVSDWLKNGKGSREITDNTDLVDVENVKGDEVFRRDGNQITWNAEGSDIFYQGTSDKEAPVAVHVSYMLDGKNITPQELAGKSGEVCIRLDYENRTSQKVNIGGKDTEVQVPFAMLSGMILPENTFSNIQVTNGRVISEGNNTIVVGVAFPGLKESLNLEKCGKEENGKANGIQMDIDIPDYLEITAEVENFELGMTMTVALSDLFSSVNSGEGLSLDGIKDSLKELGDATDELKDGSVSLEDGSRELAEGTESLVEGVSELKDGSAALKSGTRELYEKSGQLDEGAGKLKDGSAQLADGAGQLSDGTQALADGLGQLDAGVKAMQIALETGSDNTPAVLAGSQSLADGANALNTLINEYFITYETQINTVIDAVLQQMNSTNTALAAAQAELVNAEAQRDAAKAVLDQACNGEVQQIEMVTGFTENDSVSGGDSVVTEVTTEVNSITVCQPEQLKSATDAYSYAEAQVAVCQANVSALEEKAAGLQTQLAQLRAILQANTPLADDATSTKGAYIALIKTYSGQLAVGATTLNAGLKTLDAGVQQLNNESAGVPALKAGAQALQSGINTVKGGAETLGSKTAELKDGTSKLAEGTKTLNDGAGTLEEGIKTLYDGAATLEGGMFELSGGCIALKDGLFQFDEEGISKLTELADGDTREVLDRLKAVVDAGKEYKTFTSLSDGMDGSVKFIIKTDGVKAE